MLQTSLLLMKSLNINRNSHFLIRSVFFVSEGNLFGVYYIQIRNTAIILYFMAHASILCIVKKQRFLQTDSEDSDKTARTRTC